MTRSTCAPDVYFPIEIPAREYAGHLLLAVELASRGLHCTLGRKGETVRLMAAAERKGLIFYKHGLRIRWTEDYHSLVAQDPEAGVSWVRFADFSLGTATTHGRTIMHANPRHRAQFCFGPDDHDFLRERHPDEAQRIHLTGSPRVSLWGAAGDHFYRQQVSAIRERYGRPVLFTSSGGFEHERYLDLEGREHDSAWSQHSGALGLLEAARTVARETDVPVVIRPHPGESFNAWTTATSDDPRIAVNSSLDLAAWVRASIAVVHAGTSTAAVEAVCGGVPALSADTQEDRHYYISPLISHPAGSADRLLELVGRAADGHLEPLPDPSLQNLLEHKILHPLDGAAQRIADIILAVVPFGGESALRRLPQRRPGLLRRAFARRAGDGDPLGPGTETRFKGWLPDLTQVEHDVSSAADILGLSTRPSVDAYGKDLYIVRPPT